LIYNDYKWINKLSLQVKKLLQNRIKVLKNRMNLADKFSVYSYILLSYRLH